MRELLRQAIERARVEESDFAASAGSPSAERLGSEVTRLARLAMAAHLAEATRRQGTASTIEPRVAQEAIRS